MLSNLSYYASFLLFKNTSLKPPKQLNKYNFWGVTVTFLFFILLGTNHYCL